MIAAAFSTPAYATVFEIADDGIVLVHDAPVLRASKAADLRAALPRLLTPPASLQASFDAASGHYALSRALVEAVAWTESRFQPSARSPVGAIGVMQLMPATARDLGVDPRLPDQNIRGGTAYLRMLLDRYAGDIVKALAAYNAGPGAVDRYGGVPPYAETRAYVARILGRLAANSVDTKKEIRR
ncbi:MAG: lytic transglycosylase domain-containing protein [Sphingomonadaceae bacterium]|jgi:soluble lytic murein transglycosylase-like protein|nr:lytic transglycosylase domain-containing protein [Sphingomonadaceae bacterium]